ncbi:MAG: ABC transporter permease, partial [Planctomycetes bacterium]|nr:ABC transporter permease [Planctomycetota bacterium]
MTTPDKPTYLLTPLFASFPVFWGKWRSSFVLALRSLWLHKLRSILSVLGIIIGTGAVITLMAFGKGSMEDALEDIRRQGTTNIIVHSVKPPDDPTAQRTSWVANYGLTWDDYDRLSILETVVGMVPMRIFPQQIRYIDRVVMNARVVATTEDYAKINHFNMAVGRFLVDGEDQRDEGDDQRSRNVIVLGARVAEELFPFKQAVGQSVVLKGEQYVVVGVIKDRTPRGGTPSGGQKAEDFNNDVYIPLNTAKLRFGARMIIRQGGSRSGEQVELHQITLTVSDIDKVRSTGDVVRNLLERYHQKQDWDVAVPLDRLEEAERARSRGNWLLAAIAAISLLVGGIGIMNIMLATVTERTREIGIRRALGAKRRDITMQFIIEAVVQTTIGGLLGMAAGFAIIFGVPFLCRVLLNSPLPAQLDIFSIFLSLGVAIAVGVGFG